MPKSQRCAAELTSAFLVLVATSLASAQQRPQRNSPPAAPEIKLAQIPKLETGPKLSDFEGMQPVTPLAKKMLKVDKFTQHDPKDGAPDGDFVATVFLVEETEVDGERQTGPNVLPAVYSKPETSPLKFKITSSTRELAPLELTKG